jgi:CheY-like chemotaxis protein
VETRVAGSAVEILLVEDNPADVELAEEGLQGAGVRVGLNVVRDGDEALRYLRGEGEHAGVPPPDLVLLDLKMPRKGGREVLAEVKADPALRRIPVVVMTSSDAPEDVRRAYELHASCYVTKPADLHEFRRVMRALRDFCLGVAKLPPRD